MLMKPSFKLPFLSSFLSSFLCLPNASMFIIPLPDGFLAFISELKPSELKLIVLLLLSSLLRYSSDFSKSFNISLVLLSNSAFSFSNFASLSCASGSNLISLNYFERKSYILSVLSWSFFLSSAVKISSKDYYTGFSNKSFTFPNYGWNAVFGCIFLSSTSKSNSPWGLWTTSKRFEVVTTSDCVANFADPVSKSNWSPPSTGY